MEPKPRLCFCLRLMRLLCDFEYGDTGIVLSIRPINAPGGLIKLPSYVDEVNPHTLHKYIALTSLFLLLCQSFLVSQMQIRNFRKLHIETTSSGLDNSLFSCSFQDSIQLTEVPSPRFTSASVSSRALTSSTLESLTPSARFKETAELCLAGFPELAFGCSNHVTG